MADLYARGGKRVFDVAGAAAGLVLASPLLLLTALLVRIGLGSPVLFRQRRPGLHGRVFTIYKFRTMRDARDDEKGRVERDAGRLTRIGRFLRGTSLDELPELVNVLRGDMSLVGPRPLLVDYLPRYTREQARRHEVRPGITGHAQVNGRNALSWEEKFTLDVWYVDHVSPRTDLRILALTVWRVLQRRGISAPGQPIAEPFLGTSLHRDLTHIPQD